MSSAPLFSSGLQSYVRGWAALRSFNFSTWTCKHPQQHGWVDRAQVWGRPLAGGRVAAVFFNRGEVQQSISATFEELGLAATVKRVKAVDVWTGVVTQAVATPFEARGVPPHAAKFVTLDPM